MVKNNQTVGIIPARYASSRFPGKPLALVRSKSMIRRVYEQARKCVALDEVVVATDDERIFRHVEPFGRVTMTAPFHTTGTDRCAEVAARPDFAQFGLVVNIQGDEPFLHPDQVARALEVLQKNEQAQIGTLAKCIDQPADLSNPNVVKVVFGQNGLAHYFSRSAVPYLRATPREDWLSQKMHFKHIGLYAFRREVLLQLAKLPPGNLEQAESLEQLRWLENGFRIGVGLTKLETVGIDTPEDLEGLR